MLENLSKTIEIIKGIAVPNERKEVLYPLVEYIQNKVNANEEIRLNFICTHNSRRSHLSQIWAQTMAFHYGIQNVYCYSGGTEATALFPKVAETLSHQGFQIQQLSQEQNPVYAVKFDDNEHPIIGFSKTYFDAFNPKCNFAAIMTCSHADENCPLVIGASARIALTYDDPKEFDGTPLETTKYAERVREIGREILYAFSQVIA